jgi:hypothetical protein
MDEESPYIQYAKKNSFTMMYIFVFVIIVLVYLLYKCNAIQPIVTDVKSVVSSAVPSVSTMVASPRKGSDPDRRRQ